MKLKKALANNVPRALSVDDYDRLTIFVQILVHIDNRVNICKGKTQKKKSAKKAEITSITKGSQYREPFLLDNPLSSSYLEISPSYYPTLSFFNQNPPIWTIRSAQLNLIYLFIFPH